MVVKQRSDWTAADIAEHAMEATSLSQLTLPEVKKLAACILASERNAMAPDTADPKPSKSWEILRGIRDGKREL